MSAQVTQVKQPVIVNCGSKKFFTTVIYSTIIHNACVTFRKRLLSVGNITVSAVSRFLSFYHHFYFILFFCGSFVSDLNKFDMI